MQQRLMRPAQADTVLTGNSVKSVAEQPNIKTNTSFLAEALKLAYRQVVNNSW